MNFVIEEKTNLKEQLVNTFESFSELYGKSFPALRVQAMEEFNRIGFPSSKNEEWKYISLASFQKNNFAVANAATKVNLTREDIQPYKVAGNKAAVLVFVNGLYQENLSDLTQVSDKIKLAVIDEHSSSSYFGKQVKITNEHFNALNTAFHSGGILIHVPANVQVENTIHLLHINDSRTEPFSSFPRNLLVVDKNAKAQVIASYHSLNDDNASFTNAVTEIFVGENAFVEFDVKQNETEKAVQVNHVYAKQQRNSVFDICTVTVGGGLVRNNLDILLSEENCTAHLYGLTIAGDNQIVDNHTVVDHAHPHCESNQLYKNILDGKAQGVFNGKIFVRKDAQKTNAFQSSKNVLLSNDATMSAKPQLEIFADDVKCSHGATTGQLDDDALFYFRARGIGEADAKALLNFAFAGDVIEKINNEPLKQNLLKLLAEKLNTSLVFEG